MIDKHYEGSMCEIKTLKSAFIMSGTIKSISAVGIVEIINPYQKIDIIPEGSELRLYVFSATKDFAMFIGEVLYCDNEVLKLSSVVDLADYERRRFFRVNIDEYAAVIRKHEDGEPPQEAAIVKVKNLSLCGIKFASPLSFKTGEKIFLSMPLYKSAMHKIDITIQRNVSAVGENYMYAGEITGLAANVEKSLCAFLFEHQRRQIKKMRE